MMAYREEQDIKQKQSFAAVLEKSLLKNFANFT